MFKIGLIILFFIASCGESVQTTEEEHEVLQPFYLEFIDDGMIIYPGSMDEMKNIISAKFYFTPVTFRGDVSIEDALMSSDNYGKTLEYNYPVSESVGFFEIGKDVIGILSLKITYKTSSGNIVEEKLSGKSLVGTMKIKFMPFFDFDSPVLSLYSFQTMNNFFFYMDPVSGLIRVTKLPEFVDKFFPVPSDYNHIIGCYTKIDESGVYCNLTDEETKIVTFSPDKFYAEYFGKDDEGKDMYRIYVLKKPFFYIFEYKDGIVTLLFREENVRSVTPSLSDVDFLRENGLEDTIFPDYIGFRLFYLLKDTDETLVEVVSPTLSRKYFYYPRNVSVVAHTFSTAEGYTTPFRPGGVVYEDGTVRIEAFDKIGRPLKEYRFPGRAIDLWVLYHSLFICMYNYYYGTGLSEDMVVSAMVLTDRNRFYLIQRGLRLQPIKIIGNILKANYLFLVGDDGSLTLIKNVLGKNRWILDNIITINNFVLLHKVSTAIYSDSFDPDFFVYNREELPMYVNPFYPASRKYIVQFEEPMTP